MVHSTQIGAPATGPLNIATLSPFKRGRGLETGSTAVTSAKLSVPGIAKRKPSGRDIELKRNWLILILPTSFGFQRWSLNRSTLGALLSAVVVPTWPAMPS